MEPINRETVEKIKTLWSDILFRYCKNIEIPDVCLELGITADDLERYYRARSSMKPENHKKKVHNWFSNKGHIDMLTVSDIALFYAVDPERVLNGKDEIWLNSDQRLIPIAVKGNNQYYSVEQAVLMVEGHNMHYRNHTLPVSALEELAKKFRANS